MRSPNSKVTQERLRELFNYDSIRGGLTRKIAIKGSNAGTVIGTKRLKGYLVAVVDGKMYRVHHLVWMFHNGQFESELDHVNRVRDDNRIENLRPCSRSQNLGNARARVHKYKGVTFCKQTKKWRAQIASRAIGRYATIEEAAIAYNGAAVLHYGEFALLNEVQT
jgi:phage terminase large subunit-like protein